MKHDTLGGVDGTGVDGALAAPAVPSGTLLQTDGSATLKLYVCGLERDERPLLEGLVRVSQRRSPRLQLLETARAQEADVLLVGASDQAAVTWVRRQPWIRGKALIWLGSPADAQAGQYVLRRPVQWSVLPLHLARALEQTSARAPSTPAMQVQVGSRPILVVDDSLAIRNHLSALLRQAGYAVAVADSVAAAMQILQQQSIDCVLMDVLMPDVDGYEGCRQIKSLQRGQRAIPVVMLTSKSSPFDRIRGKMAGCDAYLTKPVDASQLGAVLAQQLQPFALAQAQGETS